MIPPWIIEWCVLQYHVYKLFKILAKDMDESYFILDIWRMVLLHNSMF
jgi:hypothetical protein